MTGKTVRRHNRLWKSVGLASHLIVWKVEPVEPSIPRMLQVLEKWSLGMFVVSIPWQVYFPLYGRIDISVAICLLSLLFGIACARHFTVEVVEHMSMAVWGYSLMLLGIGVASLLRAPGNLSEATNVLGRLGVGFLALCSMHLLSNAKRSGACVWSREAIIRYFLWSTAPLGMVGLVLFFAPALEDVWRGLVAGVLIEGDTAQVQNNALALDRIGVVFMNANVGAVFWGMSMWLALWMRQRAGGLRRVAYTLLAAVFCIDVLSTGSRAGMLALASTVIGVFGIRAFYTAPRFRIDRSAWVNTAIVFLSWCFVFGVEFSGMKQETYLDAIKRTTVYFNESGHWTAGDKARREPLRSSDKLRLELLESAFAAIRERPFLGYGVVDFATLGFPKDFPPHNFFLLVWIYGGIGALIGIVLVFLSSFCACMRRLSQDHDMWLPLAALLWVAVQAMLTNLILGDLRVAMLLWIIVTPFAWAHQTYFAPRGSG